MRRLALVLTAAALPFALVTPASADLRDWCWENVPGFRTAALVCTKVPGGVG